MQEKKKMQEERKKLREELLREPGLDDLGNAYTVPVGKKIVSQCGLEKNLKVWLNSFLLKIS